MLLLDFQPNNKFVYGNVTTYPEVLNHNGRFRIIAEGQTLFEEAEFPIYEFLLYTDKWLRAEMVEDMLFNSLETEDNPLISFVQTENGWIIQSAWQICDCPVTYSAATINAALKELKATISPKRFWLFRAKSK